MIENYSQLYVHFVFGVKFRKAQIQPWWERELYDFFAITLIRNKHLPLAINGMPDHVHIFASMHPAQSIADLLRQLKGGSSYWINSQTEFTRIKFAWQDGYGAFSYSPKHVENVIRYIKNQKVHHQKQTFDDEYRRLSQSYEFSPYAPAKT